MNFNTARAELPLIAILRGVTPGMAVPIGEALVEAGFRLVEVPLNSPNPFDSIARLATALAGRAVVGAGTVLDVVSADAAAAAGASLILAPNTDVRVITHAAEQGLTVMPGVATASEAFAAIGAGATALKLFPADVLGAGTVAAWRAVLPAEIPIFAVGGIDAGGQAAFLEAGVAGFGIGSALYRPGASEAETAGRARAIVSAWRRAAR